MEATLTSHILIFRDGQVLLVRHNEKAGHLIGTYGIPGGHLDGDESLKQAAVREFEEETGLKVLESELQTFPRNEYTADIPRKDGTVKRYTMHIYIAGEWSGSLVANNETTPEWVDINQLDTINLLPNVKNAIQAAKEFLEEGYVNEG